MKKFRVILLSVLSLFTSASLHAQVEEGSSLTPEERATKWTEWMKKELNISADQETKVQTINLKYAQQTESLREKDGSRKSRFKEAKSIDDAKDNELKAIFTSEQFNIYQEKKREMQKKIIKSARERRDSR